MISSFPLCQDAVCQIFIDNVRCMGKKETVQEKAVIDGCISHEEEEETL